MVLELLAAGTFGLLLGAAASTALLRRQAQRVRRAERRAQAAERMAEIGSMTGGLAHEIKNPLSTIGLNAQLLAESIQDSPLPAEEKTRLVNRIGTLRRETERLKGILADFLEFAGQIRLDPKPADINTLVSDLCDFYTPEAERTGTRLRLDLTPGPLSARVDARRIKQCVLNLMLNAVQAMSPPSSAASPNDQTARAPGAPIRGELILRTVKRTVDRAEFVEIHVIDTGPGIAPDVASRIFNPYFSTKAGGSGLGLPTARRLIEAHGGRIDLFSEPGKGSDFVIVLPVAGPADHPVEAQPAKAG